MQTEKSKFIQSIIFPSLFVMFIWLVKITEIIFHFKLSVYGIMPLKASGLTGIITSPLIHGDIAHLSANTIPLWILSVSLFYFYKPIAYKIFFLIYFITGIWVWFWAREAFHIGASGLVYGIASFLFFSGIFRKDTRLMAISLFVAFLYGGIVWGVFPHFYPKRNISWESHFMGLLCGFVLAVYFRQQGPKRKIYSWEFEEDDDSEDDESAYWKIPPKQDIKKEQIK